VIALWIVGLPLVQLSRLNNLPALVLGGVAAAALIVGGLALDPGARRARSVASLVLLTAGLLSGARFLPTDLSRRVATFANVLPGRDMADGQRVAVAAMLLAVAVAVVWLGLGLMARDLHLPLGALLAPLPVGVLLILVPGGAGWHLLPSALLVLASLPIGRRFLRLAVGWHESDRPLGWVVSFCLGLGMISLLWLVLGSLRLLTPIALMLAILGSLAVAWRDVWHLARGARAVAGLLAAPIPLRQNAAALAAATLLAALILMNLMAALAPDLGSDAVREHLAIAARFARQGSLEPGIETQTYYLNIPVQVLYAGLAAWSGPLSAKVLHFAYGVLAAAGTGALASHLTGRRDVGLIAATLFEVPSLVWWLAGTAYVDLAITFYFLATVCALVCWVETGRRGWVLAAGLAAGVAIPSKLTSAALGGVLVLTILVRERRSLRAVLASCLACGIPALLVWAPWLLRSYLLSGNPVFPWFNQIFRSPLVEPVGVFAGVPFGIGTSPTALLSLPFAVTFAPGRFMEAGELGAHWLALTPLLVLLAGRSRLTPPLAVVLAAAALWVIVWAYILFQNLRYLLPALPMFAVLLAAGYHYATRPRSRPLVPASAVAALFLATMANALNPDTFYLRGISGEGLPYHVVLGHETPETYIRIHARGAGALQYLNATYHGNAWIWAPYFQLRVYSDAPIVFNDVFTTLPLRTKLAELETQDDVRAVYEGLRQLGFTHVLVDGARREMSLPPAKRPAFMRPDFLDRFARLEYADNGVLALKLLPAEQEPPVGGERELLRNGGFEQRQRAAMDEWQPIGTPLVDASGGTAHSGQVAVAVDGANLYTAGPLKIVPGRTYRLRVYARAEQPGAVATFRLEFLSENKQGLPGEPALSYTPGADYRSYEMASTAPAEARYVRITLGGEAAEQAIWVDDVSLTELLP
jgi:hypothetical protein